MNRQIEKKIYRKFELQILSNVLSFEKDEIGISDRQVKNILTNP